MWDAPCPIPYRNQANAWVDRVVYRDWWLTVFLPEVRNWTSNPVALLMDNCAGHDPNCIDPIGQVDVYFIPPHVTSVYQPLDEGIIAAAKVFYMREMVGRLVEANGKYDELQEAANKAKKGRKGLRFGSPANMLDAARIIQRSWNSVTRESIVRCWKRVNCIPHPLEQYEFTVSASEKSISSEQATDVTSVCDVISSISRHPKNQGNRESL